MKKKLGSVISTTFFLLATSQAFATAYSVPPANESLIGNIQNNLATQGDTVVTVAERHDLGYNAIKNANPQLDMTKGFPIGAHVQLPSQHLLPTEAREGIVINLPEMRMYYYPTGSNEVLTYPIGIGKIGKTIPIKKTTITRKKKDPVWIPPQDIREFNLKQGIVLPRIMPAGPDNPLGQYAIYTGLPTYLIHSTIFPESVGTRASFGCIRMYETDIKNFFPSISSGIPLVIINRPVKVAWQNDELYMEAYQPLEEHEGVYETSLPGVVHTINESTKNQDTLVDWQLVSYISKERDGIPHQVGIRIVKEIN